MFGAVVGAYKEVSCGGEHHINTKRGRHDHSYRPPENNSADVGFYQSYDAQDGRNGDFHQHGRCFEI